MSDIDICALHDIEDYAARGFSVEIDNETIDIVIVRQGEITFAYRNNCPHTGVNLEWQPHEFLSDDANYLQCAMHGALFRIEDGVCVAGPCNGERLQPVTSVVRQGRIFLHSGDDG